MSWDRHHTDSERLAQAAQAATDEQGARDLYCRAAEAEARALLALDPAKSRTRGITAVSALSLWLKGAEYGTVRARGDEFLQDASLPHFAKVQIRELVEAAEGTGGTQQQFEVDLTFRQTLRYAISAQDRKAAEEQAVTLWKLGDESDVLASPACELLEVQAHASAGSDHRD